MDPSEWFDDGRYSDLTIKLSDGTEVKVHKVVICQANEYFRKVCGFESQFAESKQPSIELKDDDPIALKNLLRFIYGLEAAADEDFISSRGEWRFWLNLRTVADKYLECELSNYSDEQFRRIANETTDLEMVFDIVDTIETNFAHEDSLLELSNNIRKKHYAKLLKNDRFRAKLDKGDRDALWQVIDDLAFAADLKEKCYHLCRAHESKLFHEPSGDKEKTAVCTFCQSLSSATRSGAHFSAGSQQQERVVWTQK